MPLHAEIDTLPLILQRLLAVALATAAMPTGALAQSTTPNSINFITNFAQTSQQRDIRMYGLSRNGAAIVGSRIIDYYSSWNGSFLGSALVGFRWGHISGSLQSLAPLVTLQNSEAVAISADGFTTITGGGSTFPQSHLVNWRFNSGTPTNPVYALTNSGVYPGGVATTGLGVTDDGAMVVGYIRYPNGQNQSMRQFIGAAPIENLGAITPGADSAARACSGDGSIIVGHSDGAIGTKAARWESGVWSSIGTLPGGANSYAYGISQDGVHIVGFSEFAGSGTNYHPFLHTMAGGMIDLGLPTGTGGPFGTGYAWNVNNDATVVVGEARASQGAEGRATVWTPQTGTLHLTDALQSAGYSSFGGIVMTDALGVSGDGRTIAGNGYLPRTPPAQNIPIVWVIRNFTLAPTGTPALYDRRICTTASNIPARFELTGQVRGLPPLTYTWARNGQPISPSDPQYTLAGTILDIADATLEPDGTTFTCTVTNAHGSISATGTVHRDAPVVFTAPPGTVTVPCSDRLATFPFTFTGGGGGVFKVEMHIEPHGWLDITGGASLPCGGFAAGGGQNIYIHSLCPGITAYPIRFWVGNTCGNVVSEPGMLIVDTTTPVITAQPAPRIACPHESVSFSVAATGTGPLFYQWHRNAFPIDPLANPSAATDTLLIPRAAVYGNSTYTCTVLNECLLQTTSNPATLTVCAADFNCDGSVTADDIFAFLDAWFAQNGVCNGPTLCTGDFNIDLDVTADDIFSFLDAWFVQNGVCGN